MSFKTSLKASAESLPSRQPATPLGNGGPLGGGPLGERQIVRVMLLRASSDPALPILCFLAAMGQSRWFLLRPLCFLLPQARARDRQLRANTNLHSLEQRAHLGYSDSGWEANTPAIGLAGLSQLFFLFSAALRSVWSPCPPAVTGSASGWQGPNTQKSIAEVLGVFRQLPQPSHAHRVRTFGFSLIRTTLVSN